MAASTMKMSAQSIRFKIQIATLNVRGLSQISKRQELDELLARKRVDMCCLQETKVAREVSLVMRHGHLKLLVQDQCYGDMAYHTSESSFRTENNKTVRNQIDCVLGRISQTRMVTQARAYHVPQTSTNHRMVVTTISSPRKLWFSKQATRAKTIRMEELRGSTDKQEQWRSAVSTAVMAKVIGKYYNSLFNIDAAPLPPFKAAPLCTPVSVIEVAKVASRLKNGRSFGADGELLKHCSSQPVDPMANTIAKIRYAARENSATFLPGPRALNTLHRTVCSRLSQPELGHSIHTLLASKGCITEDGAFPESHRRFVNYELLADMAGTARIPTDTLQNRPNLHNSVQLLPCLKILQTLAAIRTDPFRGIVESRPPKMSATPAIGEHIARYKVVIGGERRLPPPMTPFRRHEP
uniref:Endonuclease/exonuclease/phosphatase domain-containing protein n=1 Tax=Branchiostoma floridae TaxID=7739 RepID=C4A0C9_BRAFL|eukprot:XP_002585745.1 hypothetical protein BRAFLDRAFT_111271 [Branchiostoma floridae]